MEGPRILTLMLEARLEVYQLIDFHYKPMPKKPDGSIDDYGKGLGNNDIDALRHAYVSGRYTMEFGEATADILGRLNEFKNFNFGEKEIPSENLDLCPQGAKQIMRLGADMVKRQRLEKSFSTF